MKKRLVSILLIASMVMSLTACGDKDDDGRKRSRNKKNDDVVINASVVEDLDPQSDKKDVLKYSVLPFDNANRYIIDEANKKVIFLNADGSIYDQIIDYTSILEEVGPNAYLEAVGYHKLYISNYNDNNEKELCEYNYDNGEYTTLCTYQYIDSVEPYEDEVYVSTYDYTDSNTQYTFHKLTPDGSNGYKDEVVFEDFTKGLSDNNRNYSLYNNNGQIYFKSYALNNFDYIPTTGDSGIELYDPQGNFVRRITDDKGTICAYSDKYVIYSTYDDNYNDTGIHVYDIEEDTDKVIFDRSEYAIIPTVVGLYGDYVFVIVNEDVGKYHNDDKLVRYDLANDTSEELHTESHKAGTETIGSYSTGFKIIDDNIYILSNTVDGQKDFVIGHDIDSGVYFSTFGATTNIYSYQEYGTVTSEDCIKDCPICGEPAFKGYMEGFQFNSDAVDNADLINEDLKAKFDTMVDDMNNHNVDEITDDDCQWNHKDYSYYDTDEMYFSDVNKVLDHYISVKYNGYDYWAGAAHGYPYYYDYLYDTDTGKEVTFSELYTGSEDDLKNIVAEKAKEEYEKTEAFDGMCFSEDADALAEVVRDEVNIQYANVSFYEDYFTYNFMPYDLTAYAYGMVSIPVSYDEVGIY